MKLLTDFNENKSREDGRQIACRECHAKHNERSNGISRLATQIAGTHRALYELPREERLKIRSVAAQMYDNGQDFATAQRAEQTDRRGFVYIITNPAWPGYCKVGRAFDPDARLRNYQTGSPERDYELKYAVYFEDCYQAEKLIHDTLADYQSNGEWFRILPTVAEHVLDEIGGYL